MSNDPDWSRLADIAGGLDKLSTCLDQVDALIHNHLEAAAEVIAVAHRPSGQNAVSGKRRQIKALIDRLTETAKGSDLLVNALRKEMQAAVAAIENERAWRKSAGPTLAV